MGERTCRIGAGSDESTSASAAGDGQYVRVEVE